MLVLSALRVVNQQIVHKHVLTEFLLSCCHVYRTQRYRPESSRLALTAARDRYNFWGLSSYLISRMLTNLPLDPAPADSGATVSFS